MDKSLTDRINELVQPALSHPNDIKAFDAILADVRELERDAGRYQKVLARAVADGMADFERVVDEYDAGAIKGDV